MPFEEVRYFPELRQILALARTQVASTLGICWGALALGQLVGVDKKLFRKKLFGVYRDLTCWSTTIRCCGLRAGPFRARTAGTPG